MKKVISFILSAFMLIGTLPMLASAEDVTNFNPVKVTVTKLGAEPLDGSTYNKLVVKNEFPFDVTTDDQLNGCYLNGTITYNGTSDATKNITLENVAIKKQNVRTDGDLDLILEDATDKYTFVNDVANYTIDVEISSTPKNIDETNFTPFKFNVSAIGSDGKGHTRLLAYASEFPFEITEDHQLRGCVINGTITQTSDNAVMEFVDVQIVNQELRLNDPTRINLDFVEPAASFVLANGGSYKFDLTISPAPDVTNFDPVKITVTRLGAEPLDGSTYNKLVVKNEFPFDVTTDDQLNGCYLNGTITYNGTSNATKNITLENVAIKKQNVRTDGDLDLILEDSTDKYTFVNDVANYTIDVKISSTPKSIDETNFAPFKIKMQAIGSVEASVYGVVHKRFVIANEFPFDVTTADQLAGCVLKGTVTYNGEEIEFNNIWIAHQSLRDTKDKVNLEFVLPVGSAIDFSDTTLGNYTFDLTIYPVGNISPFKIVVNRTGTPDEKVTKRLLLSNTLGIDTNVGGELTGYYLNGTVTYDGDGEYSKIVIFKNVPVTQEARKEVIQLDFTVPAGYSICLKDVEDNNYVWDLTLSREQSGDIRITNASVADNKVSLTVENDTFAGSGALKLVAAAYKTGGQLVDVTIKDLTDIAAGGELPVSDISFSSDDWAYSRVFIWYDLASMIPMSDAVQANK